MFLLDKREQSLPCHIWQSNDFPGQNYTISIATMTDCVHTTERTIAELLDRCKWNNFMARILEMAEIGHVRCLWDAMNTL